MRIVRWTNQARSDLAAIRAFISQDSPHYASIVVAHVFTATDRLVAFPESVGLYRNSTIPPFARSFIARTESSIGSWVWTRFTSSPSTTQRKDFRRTWHDDFQDELGCPPRAIARYRWNGRTTVGVNSRPAMMSARSDSQTLGGAPDLGEVVVLDVVPRCTAWLWRCHPSKSSSCPWRSAHRPGRGRQT